ncbi:AraC family transcriptional regulator [Vibrio brasiliensis]|uniref:AraC family transcriptional regulator n=1 Tax=Vibrio brasiliensis TaxID=170652 RepID=UPI001EFDB2DE|nr:AraC family transcriptional regulator [Vibrio brasiliensis]MCG9726437.1 AraC family transcriptional regulator [Vibrio brasiliensis]
MQVIAHYQPTDQRHQLGVMDVALLLNAVESFGVRSDSLVTEAGLAEIDWYSEQSQITYADKLKLFGHVNRQWPGLGLGLLVGEQATLSHFGILGYAILSSRTVQDAINTGFKYLDLNGPVFSVTVEVERDIAAIRLENVLDVGEMLPFCSEYFLSSIASLFLELTGQQFKVNAIRLPYQAPEYHARYQQRFACEAEFNQDELALYFNAGQLALPLTTHNADKLSHYLKSCDSLVAALQSPYLLTNQIKAILYQSAGAFPTFESLAVQFGCSERTLRRQLELHKTSYQALLNEVRGDLAKEYLLGTRLTVEEIGFRLGYSDSANFRRAFKRWTGITPQQFRAEV